MYLKERNVTVFVSQGDVCTANSCNCSEQLKCRNAISNTPKPAVPEENILVQLHKHIVVCCVRLFMSFPSERWPAVRSNL